MIPHREFTCNGGPWHGEVLHLVAPGVTAVLRVRHAGQMYVGRYKKRIPEELGRVVGCRGKILPIVDWEAAK